VLVNTPSIKILNNVVAGQVEEGGRGWKGVGKVGDIIATKKECNIISIITDCTLIKQNY